MRFSRRGLIKDGPNQTGPKIDSDQNRVSIAPNIAPIENSTQRDFAQLSRNSDI